LLFRSEEHVDRWCVQHRTAHGSVASIEQVWRLARAWYADRLDEEWSPRSPETMERLFADAGLFGEFWRVR
jgi:hypothetical protein